MRRLTNKQCAEIINIAKKAYREEIKLDIKGQKNDKKFFQGYLAAVLTMTGCRGQEVNKALINELILATEEAQEL